MRKILQKIYRQPKEVRDNYALALAGIFTAVVCVFWVTARLQAPIEGGSIVSDNAGPFSTLVKKSKEQLAVLMATTPAGETATSTAVVSATTSADKLIVSDENKAAAQAKAASATTTTVELQPKTVLIGTTSASTTVQ